MSDLISRNAAIVQLSHNKIGDDDCDVIIQRDIETIKALASAKKTKTGYWKPSPFWYSNYCSNCNYKSEEKSNYCPDCGAIMDGEPKGEKMMNKKLAELKVNKIADYYDKTVKALEEAGFVLVLDCETMTENYYTVAESEDKK